MIKTLVVSFFTFTLLVTSVIFGRSMSFAATSYNRAAAVSYANSYASNTQILTGPGYTRYGDDCANFASQAVHAGGQPTNSTWQAKSSTWIDVRVFGGYVVSHWNASITTMTGSQLAAKYTSASAFGGDVYIYDWGKGELWSHESFSTGYGTFAAYSNYRQWGSAGDYANQHVTDRKASPYNLGYLMEANAFTRSKMKIDVVHIPNTNS